MDADSKSLKSISYFSQLSTKVKELLEKIKKENTLSASEKLLNNRQEVIDAFKMDIFPYIDGFQIKEEWQEEPDEESEEESEEKNLKNRRLI